MGFDPIDVASWRAQVLKELRGRPLERLVAHLPGGLSVQPLYTAADRTSDGGQPGQAPYTRGAAVWSAWDISPRHDDPRREVLRASIADDLDNGATGLWLRLDRRARLGGAVGDDGATLYTRDDFAAAFAGRDLSGVHARLDAGAAALPAAAQWSAVAAAQGTSLGSARLRFCMDPAASLMRDGALPAAMGDLWSQAASLVSACAADMPAARALTVSTGPVHQAGADAPLELGVALAGVVEALSGLSQHHDASQIASQIELSIPMGRDIFLNVARLRALRTLWSHLLSHCGLDAVPPPDIHAFSAPITLSQRDPWSNMLRVTTQVFSAIVGGAQRVTAAAFDEALGQPEALGRRVARNTPLILREESHLGQVTDPAGGSHYVEALTEQLVASAWARFQSIYDQGGVITALRSGWLQEALSQCWSSRREEIAHRRWAVTGVSTFPNLGEAPQVRFTRLEANAVPSARDAVPALGGEDFAAVQSALAAGASIWGASQALRHQPGMVATPLPQHRDAAPFEALRDRSDAAAQRPAVFLANIGTQAEWTPRANFAANLLAAGGVSVIEAPGAEGDTPDEIAAELAARAAAAGAQAVCICGSDAAYGCSGPAVAAALKGVGPVLLAGRPDDALRAAGVDTFIHLGCDALGALDALLTRTGA